ncbi:hypothetical protein [Nocardia neocaledoniensis]|uniref:hypothetical protein n=1 Tax=Nocardia neocaledoniensis TaxID=236511 RepID=UPI002454EA57|nr:hypothetical protein [Nocardia neocaledoniensis]
MLEADIQQLRKLATTVTDVGAKIDEIDVRTTGGSITAALPGCEIGARCATAGEYIEGAWLRVSWRLAKLSTLVTSCADNYSMTDEEFKRKLASMAFDPDSGNR